VVLSVITLSILLGQAKQSPPIQLPPQAAIPDVSAKASAIDEVGTTEEAVLNITKHIPAQYNPANVPVNGSWAGAQEQDIREGEFSFSVTNSTYGGKPCKMFKAVSNWDYKPGKIRNKKVVFTPKLYVFAQISMDGKLLHMNTAYNGFGAPVQIDSVYHADSIDISRYEGANVSHTTLYPTFDMEVFNHLFEPLIRDGLVVNKQRELAFLHPVTGAPCHIKLDLNGRFDGKHEYRRYEGYKVEVTSPDTMSKSESLITRNGQLLQVNLPDNQDAVAYTFVSPDEERNWGKFQPGDWDRPASQTHPNRTRFKTVAVPVLLTNPSYILLPLPYAMAL
jgi:hypothetical protein